jgi:hypothetical protein
VSEVTPDGSGLLVAGPGCDPPGALLAPLHTDGTVHLDALPRGTRHGEIPISHAPQGARNVAARVSAEWCWRLVDGEGWALRQGSGPSRGNGTRPKLAILDPCRTVTLRAVCPDAAFPDVTHHVVLGWVLTYRSGKWKAETAVAWSTEPRPGGGRWWSIAPTDIGVTRAKELLSDAPDTAAVLTARDLARAAREAAAGTGKINELEIDGPVSTDE